MNKIKKSDITELLRNLVKIESPYFNEYAVMEYVQKWLNNNGINADKHTFYEDKETMFHGENVVGILDSGKKGPTIYLGGHLDTVNLCNGWTKPPYEGVVEDDYMYGVGSLDMKAGCVAIMLALKEFVADTEKDFIGKVIYHFVSDEEGPYGLGTVFIINDKIHNVESDADFAIITEPSAGFTKVAHPCVCLGARGGYNYQIKVVGRSAHAATPELGINALDEASKIICELNNMELMHDDKLGESSSCVINLNSQGGACSVPDTASIEIFHHAVRGETMDTIYERAQAAIDRANIKGKATIEFRTSVAEGFDGGFEPYCTDENNPFVGILAKSVREESNKEPNYAYFQSIGDFNHIGGKLKIPTVLLGPDGDNFHSYDERVKLSSTMEISNIVFNFLKKTLTTGGENETGN